MAKYSENVRLILVSEDQKAGRGANYHGKCFLLTAVQMCFLLGFLAFLTFIALRVVQIQKDIKHKGRDTVEDTIPGSDFCKSVNAENMSLVALGYLTGAKEEVNVMDPRNKVYYITDRLLTDQEACSVEAVLRLLQDKSVFVIEIGNFTNTNQTKIDYIQFLREHYTNLNRIKSTPDKFFKGSPFQNRLTYVDDFCIFAAKVLLVWQFGGSVLSPNFLLLNRKLFDNNEGFCEVDRELLFCPNQCSAYVYQLVKTILDMLTEPAPMMTAESLQRIIDKSVADYCGDQAAVRVGCVGINRVRAERVCQVLNKDCQYLRMHQWKLQDVNWKTTVQKFCPKIITKYMPKLSLNS